jgi:6-phospho-beta-glucosidase
MKICIIGAGSTYSPELIEGFIQRKDQLPVKELYLMDIDDRKLQIVGSLCERMIAASGMNAKVVLTKDLDEALIHADFVLAQIRVGKLFARILDEKIPLKYDLIGQETCGIGGFFKAMRTIPVMLDIVKRMETLCPNAWLINFSNPSGIIAQALLTKTNVKMMGLCNVPINMIDGVKKRMNLPNAEVEYLGLNHLSYITAIRDQGKDYLQEAINQGINSEAMKNIPSSGFPADAIKAVGAIPSSYLEYYYYKDEKLKKLKEVEKSRGEVCVDIEEDLLKLYQNAELHEKPALLSKRGGARYSEAAISLVDAIWNDKQEVHVVNVLNHGALDFLRDDDAVEVSAIIGKDGPKPIKVTNFKNQHIIEYIQTIKAFERHTVEAAVLGSDEEAMRAFLINPLIADYKKAKACYEELKEVHKDYLPQFKK